MDSDVEREKYRNFKTTTLAHSGLSLLLNNNNMVWSFVGKYEQVSTYVSWKIPCIKAINVRKKNIVQMRPLTAEIKNNN